MFVRFDLAELLALIFLVEYIVSLPTGLWVLLKAPLNLVITQSEEDFSFLLLTVATIPGI